MSLKAQIEAIIYVAEEPVTLEQITDALSTQDSALSTEVRAGGTPALPGAIKAAIAELIADYRQDGRGLEIKEVAGGYKMATKPEHHEVVSRFVKSLKPPVKLSLAALETLAVVAYRQPVTLPEIQEVRGVNAAGVMKNLLEKRLITTAGRKSVIDRKSVV